MRVEGPPGPSGVTLLAVAAISAVALVTPTRVVAGDLYEFGNEFEIHADQIQSNEPLASHSVAGSPTGRFVVVWERDTGDEPIQARMFGPDGDALGPPFDVSAPSTLGSERASVAMHDDGSFVVVWDGEEPDSILVRRFDSSGVPLGAQSAVASSEGVAVPLVGASGDGSFIVVWDGPGVDESEVYAQRFESSGAAVGTRFQVNTYTSGYQSYGDIAVHDDNSFVITWNSNPIGPSSMLGQRFDSTGAPAGTEFLVTSYGTGQGFPSVAPLGAGRFLATYRGPGEQIVSQRYDSDGTPLGGELQVSDGDAVYGAGAPDVGVDDDGTFVVAWLEKQSSSKPSTVRARPYDATPSPTGAEFQVNTYKHSQSLGGYPSNVSIASDGAGSMLAVWESRGQNGTNKKGVFGQRYRRSSALPSLCGPAPEPAVNCHLNAAGKSKLTVRLGPTAAKDKLGWKFNRGDATVVGEFGDPVNELHAYSVCIYDGSAAPQPLREMKSVPGGRCPSKPCWRAKGTVGFSFRDKSNRQDGTSKISLKGGDDGQTKIALKAGGESLQPPALPLTLPATVQLLIDDGTTTSCWQTTYSTAKLNDPARFTGAGP